MADEGRQISTSKGWTVKGKRWRFKQTYCSLVCFCARNVYIVVLNFSGRFSALVNDLSQWHTKTLLKFFSDYGNT